MRCVAGADLVRVTAVDESIHLSMHCYATIRSGWGAVSCARGIDAMRHTVGYPVITTTNDTTTAVS